METRLNACAWHPHGNGRCRSLHCGRRHPGSSHRKMRGGFFQAGHGPEPMPHRPGHVAKLPTTRPCDLPAGPSGRRGFTRTETGRRLRPWAAAPGNAHLKRVLVRVQAGAYGERMSNRNPLSRGETRRYKHLARKLGRPEHPCPCGECDCDLHSYDEDTVCVWCENENHAED